MNSVLVVAAHPDDEVLGCGGTLAKFAADGSRIHVAYLADGVSSRTVASHVLDGEITARRVAAQRACELLGVTSHEFGDFPDNRLDTVAILDIAKHIEMLIEKYQPSTLLTHYAGDVNVDHRRIQEAVTVACRPQKGHPVKTLLSFEVPSSTEWQIANVRPAFWPNWVVDISDHLDCKLSALEVYAKELRRWPHPRSREGVLHLAQWRGATVGVNAAEAFVLGRQLS